jgi:hypothetical protein
MAGAGTTRQALRPPVGRTQLTSARQRLASVAMRVRRADRPSDYGCAICGIRLIRQAYADERADLWCSACEEVRGIVVRGRATAGKGVLPWDERAGGVRRERDAP